MIICGTFGLWEILLILVVLIVFLLPASRLLLGRRENMTEKLDQIERLERLHRDGSINRRQFNRQKARILRRR